MIDSSATAREGGVIAALEWLDALLARAIDAAVDLYGPDAVSDPYRGLVIRTKEVDGLLDRPPALPLFGEAAYNADAPLWLAPDDALARLAESFEMTNFDVAAMVVALAPELDLRYERIFGYLHDDASRRRASVDLVLNLLCSSIEERIEARARFAPDAPLLRHHLVELVADSVEPQPSLLRRSIRVDEQIVRFVLGESTLDPRLAECAEVEEMGHDDLDRLLLAVDRRTRELLPSNLASDGVDLPRLYMSGPDDRGQRDVAHWLAAQLGRPLLVVRVERAMRVEVPIADVLRTAFREASLQHMAILLAEVDAVHGDPVAMDALVSEVAGSRVLTMLAGRGPWPPAGHRSESSGGVVVVPLPRPPAAARREYWRRELAAAGIGLDNHDVDSLADRFRLTPTHIAEAVRSAHNSARWTDSSVRVTDLFAAARAQSGHDLAVLARKVEHTQRWDDIILPIDALRQLRELQAWVAHRRRVLSEWGFARSLPLGSGVCALFAGPSGTGKTMAASVVANDLGLDLYKIDLATVVSKYIGETEKNLERIFAAAENANAILLFDEADAIFGKRSAVRDAHDRYANIEISYLLQRMEQYDGIAILATNLREHLDDAFLRRLQFIVEFPVPDQRQRELMWRNFLPADAPVDDSVDYAFLANQFRLTGANIKNIVVSAAYLASANGGRITMGHLVKASWREHQKIGRILSRTDLGDYSSMLPAHEPASPDGVV